MRFDMERNISGIGRREFCRVAGLGGAAILTVGVPRLGASDFDPASLRSMELDVSYRTEIRDLPKDAENVRIWMPVPPNSASQHITKFEVDSPVRYGYTRDPAFGTRMLYFETDTMEPFAVEARYHIARKQTGIQKVELSEAEAAQYLKLTKKVRVTPDVEAFAR